MRFSIIAAAAALAAGAQAQVYQNGTQYTTQIVTAYTTYCPLPTTIVQNNKTYTVTSATTLTITNCPCTISKPVFTTTVPAPVSTSKVVFQNSTVVIKPSTSIVTVKPTTVVPVVTGTATAAVATFTGAANSAFAASGALAGVFGLAAILL
ncbi:MAG: hypothetical protein M1829_005000 [Trizodia sp. TS-e1964]|nr:MAG: hypothetical protein M1829_005000 [Trizodia sp. TS-e1964]